MLKTEQKATIITKHKVHDSDTGSAEVQIGLLSEEISKLQSHLKKHQKDLHSKRGLLKMVSKRRKFLNYLKETNQARYSAILKKTGLKK